jgi:DNA-binding transcriptional ArsR family regulator
LLAYWQPACLPLLEYGASAVRAALHRLDALRHETSDLLRALAHPIRLAILGRLDDIGELSPRAFSNDHPAGLAAASHHFRALARGGLIELARTEQRRGAIEHFYMLSPHGRAAVGWLHEAPGRKAPVVARRTR